MDNIRELIFLFEIYIFLSCVFDNFYRFTNISRNQGASDDSRVEENEGQRIRIFPWIYPSQFSSKAWSWCVETKHR